MAVAALQQKVFSCEFGMVAEERGGVLEGFYFTLFPGCLCSVSAKLWCCGLSLWLWVISLSPRGQSFLVDLKIVPQAHYVMENRLRCPECNRGTTTGWDDSGYTSLWLSKLFNFFFFNWIIHHVVKILKKCSSLTQLVFPKYLLRYSILSPLITACSQNGYFVWSFICQEGGRKLYKRAGTPHGEYYY